MIRIRKSLEIPLGLDTKYNAEDVCKQILEDQYEKCYLCERYLGTDYQVDHLRSQANYPLLVKEWSNLFIACSYCNGKKGVSFDGILNPCLHNIEEIIEHSVLFMEKKVVFNSSQLSKEVRQTIQLLTILFNGKNGLRTCREQRFYDEFIRKINVFQYAVDEYMLGKKEEYRPMIEELLDIHSEYLGFKHLIICGNPVLKKDFEEFLGWNK